MKQIPYNSHVHPFEIMVFVKLVNQLGDQPPSKLGYLVALVKSTLPASPA